MESNKRIEMSNSSRKVVQYLDEAHASEIALVNVLQSQIAMTPRGPYRSAVEEHLQETRDHARRIEQRLRDLRHARDPMQAVVGFTEALIGAGIAFAKTPFDLMRGTSGEEKVLKNAKDACATEALEIATYTALEHLANEVGDKPTATLAASIREDEVRMLERVLREIPRLTAAVIGADIEGKPSYDIATTGIADFTRNVAERSTRTARKTEDGAKRTAQQARKVTGGGQAEGQGKGAAASEAELPIARYDALTAEEITSKLAELSQVDLATIDSYERKHRNRSTVTNRIDGLRGQEPWSGYDEQTVEEIGTVLDQGDGQRAKDVIAYERAHKNRTGVINAAERETANAS
jgi:ferritin-like metal-binding protein YciE